MTLRSATTLALAALLSGPVLARAEPPLPPPGAPDSLAVTGEGEVRVRPDMAELAVGVTAEAPRAEAALAESTKAAQRVVAALRRARIPEGDVQSRALDVAPVHARPREGEAPRITAYRATQSFAVRVRGLEHGRVGKVVDAVGSAGASLLGGVRFSLADESAARATALRAAVTDARARAGAMAAASGRTLAGIRTLEEGPTGPAPPLLVRARTAEATGGAAPPVEAGEVTVTARVTVVYDLAPR